MIPVVDGVAGETRGVVDVELLHEILSVFFHRFDADAKFRRGFFVNVAFGNQLKHLCLARTQPVIFLLEQSDSIGRLLIMMVEALGN